MAKLYGFGKEEHLYLKKEIEGLFSSEKKMLSYPYRVLYRVTPMGDVPLQLLISAPKRKLKHAVDRNRVKRLVREAYRLNKQELAAIATREGVTVQIGIIFIGDRPPVFERTEKCIKYFLSKIAADLTPNTED